MYRLALTPGLRTISCPDLDALIDAAEHAARHHRQAEDTAARNVYRGDWIGRYDLTENNLYDSCRKGWDAGSRTVAKLRDRLSDLEPVAATVRRKRSRSEYDGEVNTDRLFGLSGDIYDATRRERVAGTVGEVVIGCGVVASADTTAEELLWRATAASALSDALEARGVRTSILGYWYSSGTFKGCNDNLLIGVWAKRQGQVVDGETVASALSGWCFRTLWFLASHAAYMNGKNSKGYGYAIGTPPRKTLEQHLGLAADAKFVQVDGVFSEEAAVRLIRKEVAQLEASNG